MHRSEKCTDNFVRNRTEYRPVALGARTNEVRERWRAIAYAKHPKAADLHTLANGERRADLLKNTIHAQRSIFERQTLQTGCEGQDELESGHTGHPAEESQWATDHYALAY